MCDINLNLKPIRTEAEYAAAQARLAALADARRPIETPTCPSPGQPTPTRRNCRRTFMTPGRGTPYDRPLE